MAENGITMNESDNRITLPTPHLESDSKHEPLSERANGYFNSLVNIRVISYRRLNHDPDGVSVKAVMDGIVRAGILADDSAKQVKKVTFESIISKEEKTIIEIEDAI
jgi:Holliday junction resolvase RusA-like endonuclease